MVDVGIAHTHVFVPQVIIGMVFVCLYFIFARDKTLSYLTVFLLRGSYFFPHEFGSWHCVAPLLS